MAALEFRYLALLEREEGSIPNLEQQLNENPEMFAQAVAFVFKRSDDAEDPDIFRAGDQELIKARAEQAYKLLDRLQKLPGRDENGELIKGKVGKDLDTEAGYNAAERCGLSIVAQVKKACGDDLSKVKSCIKLTGFVNSVDDFINQPKVINGASDIIAKVFGEFGMHTRAAVSTNSLPLGVAVEVDAIFELK